MRQNNIVGGDKNGGRNLLAKLLEENNGLLLSLLGGIGKLVAIAERGVGTVSVSGQGRGDGQGALDQRERRQRLPLCTWCDGSEKNLLESLARVGHLAFQLRIAPSTQRHLFLQLCREKDTVRPSR